MVGVITEGMTQFGHGAREGRLADRLRAPHVVQQVVLRHDLPLPRGQVCEQVHDLRAHLHGPAVLRQPALGWLRQPPAQAEVTSRTHAQHRLLVPRSMPDLGREHPHGLVA
ncbi:hypothetical protein LuPra_00814 [Luteitalea pratensis]|uniref:Uncharacterized protein n=1 Tax=Luteitalea pratensis TaxID=1855912 RepID=A0A143PH84_LUTPR|nr:hypothetical protein LuPra_00814 [Luteitalea pratensis]